MEASQKFDFEIEAHVLIDDNQFTENQVGFSNCELAGGLNAEEKDNINIGDMNDHLPELNESIEPEQNRRNRRYNLRKSLAWDSAFFTSAGVLDAEELSSMITGADKSEKLLLPRIQEDITGSTESISTLGSDNLTLESLEDDLFVDIRASIQRSSKKNSNLTNSNCKTAAMEVDCAAISSLKKEDIVSQNKNLKLGLKNTSSLQTVRMSNCLPKQNVGKLGSGNAAKQDSIHSQMMSIAKVGKTNSILPKPPKTIISSSTPSSTTAAKRDSIGTGRVKSECGSSKLATVSSKETQPPKLSVLSGARRLLPKPAVSPRCSILSSSTTSRVLSTRSSTPSDGSSNTAKSTLTARRNPGKTSNVVTGPSGSIPKTPSRAAVKNKLPSPSLSSYLMSPKISSSVSPASSISEWSSASSSSSSIINQRSNHSRTSLDTSSCRSMDSDIFPLDRRTQSADTSAIGHENQGAILTSNSSKKSSAQSGIQAPTKPSGLRMPSPKIGFFDGVKSSGRTPNGHQQSQSGLPPKNGAATSIQSQSSNSKLKSAKGSTARMIASPKAISPPSLQEKSRALIDSSRVSMGKKGFAKPGSPRVTSPLAIIKSGSPKATSPLAIIKSGSPKATSPLAIIKSGSPKATSPLAIIKSGSLKATSPLAIIKSGSSKAISPLSIIKSGSPKATSPLAIIKSSSLEATLPLAITKLGSSKATSPLAITKSGSPKATSPLAIIKSGSIKANSPPSFQEKSHASLNYSCVSSGKKGCSPLSLGVKGTATGESCPNAEKVQAEDGVKQVVDAGTAVIFKENLGELNMCNNTMGSGTATGETCPNAEKVQAEDGVKQVVDAGAGVIFKENLGDLNMNNNLVSGTATGETCPNAEKVEAEVGVKQVVDAGTGLIIKESFGDLNMSNTMSSGDIKTLSVEGRNNALVSKHRHCVGDDVLGNQDHLEKIPHPICDSADKENCCVEYQGDGLTGAKIDASECALYFPATVSEFTCRAPFAPKNFSCSNECMDMPKELANQVVVVDKTSFALPSSEQKENS